MPKVAAPDGAEREAGAAGISTNAVRMAAREAKDTGGLVEYQLTRNDGKTSGWQGSPTWADRGLTEGAKHSYTVQVRDSWGNVSKASAPNPAVARDDTAPARYKVGEWQSLPYATLENCVAMRAMSITGGPPVPRSRKGGLVAQASGL